MTTPRSADDYQKLRLKGLAEMTRKGQTRPAAGCWLLGVFILSFMLSTSVLYACGFGFQPESICPQNYPKLLAYMQEHYDENVDCKACLDRFCMQVSEMPELPFAETVTAFTVIARFESHGKPDVVSGTHDYGCLQINRCHRKPMQKCGLDFYSEDHRVGWACHMVAEKLAGGSSWWGSFSPWMVMRNHGRTIKADYAELMAGVE